MLGCSSGYAMPSDAAALHGCISPREGTATVLLPVQAELTAQIEASLESPLLPEVLLNEAEAKRVSDPAADCVDPPRWLMGADR